MLQITIPDSELWDESKQEFIPVKRQTLQLEHSLVSISKWESKWHKPFFSTQEKTQEESLDYVRCMTLTQNVSSDVYKCITNLIIEQINNYIEAPMTATWFSNDKSGSKRSSEQVTAELVYYWMIALNIPFECQKWHFNRLITLIKVCNIKNQPEKKMSRKALMSRNAALNASRRKRLNTKG